MPVNRKGRWTDAVPIRELRKRRAISIGLAKGKKDLNEALRIRHAVFTKEQGIDQKLDRDGLDKKATHIIARCSGKAVGTMRIIFYNQKAKLERLAVLKAYRGCGIGKIITKYAIRYCKRKSVKEITLHAQFYLYDFYGKLGFRKKGSKFLEAGIEHIEMVMKLKPIKLKGSRVIA